MTAFFLFGGCLLFSWFVYEAFAHHARAFNRVLQWLAVLCLGVLVFTHTQPPVPWWWRVLVNLWGAALLLLPCWWLFQYVRAGYRGTR